MMADNREIWIKVGYEIFATSGHGELKIEPLAKLVGKSKSSFYHHFADIEVFIEFLLKHHIKQSTVIAEKEHKANNIDPEFINILLEHKIDLLFNRHLRIHKNIESYSKTLEISNKLVGNAFLTVWMKEFAMKPSEKQLESIYTLALENFFLQINSDTLNYEWVSNYFINLKKIASNFL